MSRSAARKACGRRKSERPSSWLRFAYFQIRINYFDALRDLHTSAAEIEGLLLSDSLQQDLSNR